MTKALNRASAPGGHSARPSAATSSLLLLLAVQLLSVAANGLAVTPTVSLVEPTDGFELLGASLDVRYSIQLPSTPPEHHAEVLAAAQTRFRVCFVLDNQTEASGCTGLEGGQVSMNHLLPGRRRLEVSIRDTNAGDRTVSRSAADFRVRYATENGAEDEHNIDFYAHRGNVVEEGDASTGSDKAFRSRFFDGVYRFSVWAGGAQAKTSNGIPDSGPGSTLDETRSLRAALPEIFRNFGIRSMLDVPCGDMTWMSTVDLHGVAYVGADISARVVQQNQQRFASAAGGESAVSRLRMSAASTQFIVLDVVEDVIPPTDLLFCRHLMFHLTPEHNLRVLRAMERSGARYLLASTYLRTKVNTKPYVLIQGHHINLLEPPYCLRDPIRIYGEDHDDMYMGLWELNPLNNRPLLGKC